MRPGLQLFPAGFMALPAIAAVAEMQGCAGGAREACGVTGLVK